MSVFKRLSAAFLAVILSVVPVLLMTACGEDEEKDTKTETTEDLNAGGAASGTTTPPAATTTTADGPVTEIQEFIRDRVNAEFSPTTIGSVEVTSDPDGGYDVSVGLNWRKEDQEPYIRATIGLYSDTLANEVATHLDSVQKLTITWTLTTVQNKLAQWKFYRNGNVMKLESKKYGDVENT